MHEFMNTYSDLFRLRYSKKMSKYLQEKSIILMSLEQEEIIKIDNIIQEAVLKELVAKKRNRKKMLYISLAYVIAGGIILLTLFLLNQANYYGLMKVGTFFLSLGLFSTATMLLTYLGGKIVAYIRIKWLTKDGSTLENDPKSIEAIIWLKKMERLLASKSADELVALFSDIFGTNAQALAELEKINAIGTDLSDISMLEVDNLICSLEELQPDNRILMEKESIITNSITQ